MAKLILLRTTMYIEGRSIPKTVISALGEVHARRDDVRYFKRSIIGTVRYGSERQNLQILVKFRFFSLNCGEDVLACR